MSHARYDDPESPAPAEQLEADPVAAAIDAMTQAAADLAATVGASPDLEPPQSSRSIDPQLPDPQADPYVRHLQQRGELLDVEEGTDLRSIPPEVKWVRYPNGRMRRVSILD